jgi:hypothetical protein
LTTSERCSNFMTSEQVFSFPVSAQKRAHLTMSGLLSSFTGSADLRHVLSAEIALRLRALSAIMPERLIQRTSLGLHYSMIRTVSAHPVDEPRPSLRMLIACRFLYLLVARRHQIRLRKNQTWVCPFDGCVKTYDKDDTAKLKIHFTAHYLSASEKGKTK